MNNYIMTDKHLVTFINDTFFKHPFLINILDRGVVIQTFSVQCASLIRVHVTVFSTFYALGLAYLNTNI